MRIVAHIRLDYRSKSMTRVCIATVNMIKIPQNWKHSHHPQISWPIDRPESHVYQENHHNNQHGCYILSYTYSNTFPKKIFICSAPFFPVYSLTMFSLTQ